ncbi:MAG: hypothetical protein IPP14_05775 [Planctomycetes bacterium]|nr:hypothetical protein [Planctomycetota bacterium]
MFNRYAIEPELVVAWCGNQLLHSLYRTAFGPASGRLVGMVPRKWEKRVFDACPDDPQMLKPRVVEFLKGMKEALYRAGAEYDEARPWVENAIAAHATSPLNAILARNAMPQHAVVIDALNEAVPVTSWDVPNNAPLSRQAANFASALQPALSRATELILVDPMLQPDKPRFRNLLLALLKAAVGGRNPAALTRVEYLCRPKPEWSSFDADCAALLPSAVPVGIALRVIKIDGTPGGQWIHDRYILTNKTGWSVPAGLDEGAPGATTVVSTLAAGSYRRSWADYAVAPRPFSESPVITVHGAA